MIGPHTADFTPLDEITELQQQRWLEQRRYVLDHSLFLRELWANYSVPQRLEDVSQLPLCDKQMLRRSQAVMPPFGDYLAAPEERVIRIHRTSGTSGQAMNLALSAADARQTAEVGARAQSAAGLRPHHRVVHCLNYQLWMGGFYRSHDPRIVRCDCNPVRCW